jgi:hypothetical protein
MLCMAICRFYRIDDFAYLTDVKTIEDIEIAKPKSSC